MTPLALRALGIGLALVAIVTGAYQFGRHVKTGEVAQEKLSDALAYAGLVREQQGIADGLAIQNTALRVLQAQKDRLITKEITRYVDVTPAAQRCTLPATWRVRHDAAATGLPADAGGGSLADGGASEVEDAAALETVGDNYATARDCLAKLAGWQRRYRALEQPSTTQ
jgi:hypothetical protein